MGRTNKALLLSNERALTRFVCERVYRASRLSFAEIEKALGMGADSQTVDADGKQKKTGKTFSRYCDKDIAKGRAASRDMLSYILRKSIELQWLKADFHQEDSWRLQGISLIDAIPLNERPSERFKNRADEYKKILMQMDRLNLEVKKTIEVISNLECSELISQYIENEVGASDYWSDFVDFIYQHQLNDVKNPFYKFRPPSSVFEAITLLNFHLSDYHVDMKDKLEIIPEVSFSTGDDVSTNNYDALLAEINELLKFQAMESPNS